MDGGAGVCQVCTKATSKYKCPGCLLKYCSVICFRSHKEGKCEPAQPEPTVTLEIDTKGNISSQNVLFPTDDTVLPETLEKLRCSRRLQAVLRNPHLREILREVDSASNTEVHIARAMREPIFTEFADICLSIVEPGEDGAMETDSEEDI
ncbi:zinc finger HIT domain-containing protein 3-like [Penaeus monodon]|uniref:zinc finger HIT domain-containing protein 3-like n=1 Tax=Penaeus monodon TaxID=6687 RepID=UPI0018A71747|nr:zinc finger HIT domain-containing protein 3-like [Penaeus monodon]